jgi:hypothetical protein
MAGTPWWMAHAPAPTIQQQQQQQPATATYIDHSPPYPLYAITCNTSGDTACAAYRTLSRFLFWN